VWDASQGNSVQPDLALLFRGLPLAKGQLVAVEGCTQKRQCPADKKDLRAKCFPEAEAPEPNSLWAVGRYTAPSGATENPVPHVGHKTRLRVQSVPQEPQSEHRWHSGLSCSVLAGRMHRLQYQVPSLRFRPAS